jgi:hypothetical protein
MLSGAKIHEPSLSIKITGISLYLRLAPLFSVALSQRFTLDKWAAPLHLTDRSSRGYFNDP